MSRTASSPFMASIHACQSPRFRGSMCGRSSWSTVRRSPSSATSTWTFLLTSDGSMSMWIFLRVHRVGLERPGDAIVEAHATGDEQICFLDRAVHPGLAVHPHHPEVERVLRREAADAEKGHRDRHVCPFRELTSTAEAPDITTPCPARITGRFALFRSSRARRTSAAGRRRRRGDPLQARLVRPATRNRTLPAARPS